MENVYKKLYNKYKEEEMEIEVNKLINKQLNKNEVKIKINIETSEDNENINDFIEYIKKYDKKKIVINKENELVQIDLNHIIFFYSDKKYNYCKTVKEEFRIKSKLYELEKMNENFLRISKSCVINIEQVKCFDLGQTGKIIVRFNDDSEQIVSRRKIKEVMNYLEERSI